MQTVTLSDQRSNKNGQTLGRKGLDTRQRLMEAAVRLMTDQSPFDLTVVGIAKEAGAAPATFYVYFNDVQDVLYALSEMVGGEFDSLIDAPLLRNPAHFKEDAYRFIDAINAVWDRHSDILLYRNLEADRGEPRFYDLRVKTAIPIINLVAEALCRGRADEAPAPTAEDCHAESVVLFAAIERLAATTHQNPDARIRGDELRAAQARVMLRMLQPACRAAVPAGVSSSG